MTTGKKPIAAPADLDAFSVKQFCARHNISISMFTKLCSSGRGPRIMKVGSRTLVSREAAADWRAAREQRGGEAHELRPLENNEPG